MDSSTGEVKRGRVAVPHATATNLSSRRNATAAFPDQSGRYCATLAGTVSGSGTATWTALAFTWDIYAFGSGADLDDANINLSGLDATNDFSSPDGLWFGRGSPSGQI